MTLLQFRIRPYGVVYLDNRLLGQTPLDPVQVPAGPHHIRVVNQDLGKEVSQDVDVRGAGENIFRYNFAR